MYLSTMLEVRHSTALSEKLFRAWCLASVKWKSRAFCDETRFRKRPQGGGRELKDWKMVFTHNNWDNVVWDESQEAAARDKVQENSQVTLTIEEIEKLDQEAALQWDKFYGIHQNRFFKDRNWLFTEFPELAPHLAHTFPQKQNPGETPSPSVPEDHSGEVNNKTERVLLEGNTIINHKSEAGEGAQQSNVDACNGDSSREKVVNCTLEKNTEIEGVLEEENSIAVVGNKDSKEQQEIVCVSPESNQEAASASDAKESYLGESATFRVLEVGCGVGNTVFPILSVNNDEGLFVYCCDFSSTAVGLVKESADYNEKRCHAFVCDVTSEDWEAPFPESSLDAIVCIFVLSALHPDKIEHVVKKMSEYLRPGGLILFRDYGRYDLAQLRFKKGRCLAENFYARGDGTRCYFFTQEELRELMMGAGLVEEQNLVDRRLQVNRGKQLTMYRVWVQAKYRKPREDRTST